LREPRLGGGNFTPARRALDKPMAIACWAARAMLALANMFHFFADKFARLR